MAGDILEMDPEKIQAMADDILDQAKGYMEQVDTISDEVGTLGTHWTGESYNAFKNSFEESYKKCEELYYALKEISTNVDEAGVEGAKTESAVRDAMEG